MRQSTKHQLWIAATAALVMFVNLGATRLWDQDEAFFARTAVEMHQRHEWVVPYFNGELFAHKPPLMFWMMRLGFYLFGVTEFAARFWSAVFGVATALLVYRLGRRMFSAQVGLWAGLAISTALMFDVVARAATPDSFLVFFSTLALYVFARHENWRPSENSVAAQAHFEPLPWPCCAAMYAIMGVAVLVKGPIGLLLPGSVIGLYLITRNPLGQSTNHAAVDERVLRFLRRFNPLRIAAAMWSMRPLTAMAMVSLVAGPWFALVAWRTDGNFLREFFGVQNFGRFVGAMDNHSGGIWYYVPAILIGFFPWSIFGIPTALDLTKRCQEAKSETRGARFLACWIVVFVGFFSIAATKLPNYVLPAYPALALATALFVDRWLTKPASVHRWWPRLAFGSLLLVGCLASITTMIMVHRGENSQALVERLGVAPELTSDLPLVGWLGLMLAGGAVGCLLLVELRRLHQATIGMVAIAVLFCMAILAEIAVRVDRHQSAPAVAQAIHKHALATPQVAQFGYFRPSLVYYADSRVEPCKNPQRVAEFLEQASDAFVVTTEEHYARLAPRLPADVAVIDRLPEFPQRGTVLILSRQAPVAQRDVESLR